MCVLYVHFEHFFPQTLFTIKYYNKAIIEQTIIYKWLTNLTNQLKMNKLNSSINVLDSLSLS